MENLVKIIDFMKNEFYFHGWTYDERTAIHPEDPQKDHRYSVKVAIGECVETGNTVLLSPGSFAFIRNNKSKTLKKYLQESKEKQKVS